MVKVVMRPPLLHMNIRYARSPGKPTPGRRPGIASTVRAGFLTSRPDSCSCAFPLGREHVQPATLETQHLCYGVNCGLSATSKLNDAVRSGESNIGFSGEFFVGQSRAVKCGS